MARARNIKPGFFTNDVLADCAPLARLLFAGLWTIADRAGRLEDRPKRIKASVLPYDDCSIEKLLNELHNHGFILRYEAEGQKLIQILAFDKHQNPHKNEAPSELPSPEQHSASTVQAPEQHSTNRADSLNPITDSLSTDSLHSVPNGTDATGVEKPKLSPDEIIFGYGVPLLTNAGSSEKQARSFLGGLRKQHGDPALIDKLRDCLREKPLQPLEWLAAALPPKGAGPPKVQSFRERDTAAASARYRSLTGKESPVVIDMPTMKAIAQ
jgi:hypothetical protein